MSIKLRLEGFDEMLEKIEEAGGTIDRASKSCLSQSAQIMQAELKTQMQASGVDNGLINRMPAPQIEVEGNRYVAHVGYDKGQYDPRDPLDAYKVIFANYGTPYRSKHGKQTEKGFIQKAKKKAKSKIKKAQKETLNKILERVTK